MIVFVIAMESEASPVIEKMTVKERKTVHGRTIVLGELCEKTVACVVCGVGKVNAAAGAQYAIDVLRADKVVNVGAAGGLNSRMEIANIYGVDKAVQYDFDLVGPNGTPMGTLSEYDSPYLALFTVPLFPLKTLGTGDRFNDDKKDYLLLTEELKADLRDMEGGAIAHVCKHSGIPFYSFKTVSDVAGNGSTPAQFKQNLALCMKAIGDNIEKILLAVDNDR